MKRRMMLSLLAAGLTALWGLPAARAQRTASECSRETLKGLVEQYCEGLAAHDPSRLRSHRT